MTKSSRRTSRLDFNNDKRNILTPGKTNAECKRLSTYLVLRKNAVTNTLAKLTTTRAYNNKIKLSFVPFSRSTDRSLSRQKKKFSHGSGRKLTSNLHARMHEINKALFNKWLSYISSDIKFFENFKQPDRLALTREKAMRIKMCVIWKSQTNTRSQQTRRERMCDSCDLSSLF